MILLPVALLALAGCKDNKGNTADAGATDRTATPREVSGQIAYIQVDSLLKNYNLFIELSKALEDKAAKAENEVTAKGRSLERSMADAQEKVDKGLVTRAQAAELQEKLMRQEQNFYAHREKVQQELMEENQVMMNNIMFEINKFLGEFNSDYKYGMILTSSGGTPVIHADPALDITSVVLEALNASHAKSKGKGGEVKPAAGEAPAAE